MNVPLSHRLPPKRCAMEGRRDNFMPPTFSAPHMVKPGIYQTQWELQRSAHQPADQ